MKAVVVGSALAGAALTWAVLTLARPPQAEAPAARSAAPVSGAPRTTPGASTAAGLAAEVARLERLLALETAARQSLEARLAEFEEVFGTPLAALADEAEDEEPRPDVTSALDADTLRQTAQDAARRSLDTILLEAGFGADEVRAYRERLDEIELQKLYLRDLATREGWIDTRRYREESQALKQARLDTRQEFGDEFYDWALFAAGHPNRVQVNTVIDGSAAAEAGLHPALRRRAGPEPQGAAQRDPGRARGRDDSRRDRPRRRAHPGLRPPRSPGRPHRPPARGAGSRPLIPQLAEGGRRSLDSRAAR
jgi:hypothetical protein